MKGFLIGAAARELGMLDEPISEGFPLEPAALLQRDPSPSCNGFIFKSISVSCHPS